MRIESFWARGFRSLRDVRIDDLGAFNVFYGPNGSGKSNLLAAIEAWLRLIPVALKSYVNFVLEHEHQQPLRLPQRKLSVTAGGLMPAHDFALHTADRQITLGGVLSDLGVGMKRVQIGLLLDATAPQKPMLSLMSVNIDGVEIELGEPSTETQLEKLTALNNVEWERQLSLVAADRMPRIEAVGARPPGQAEPLSWYFRRGQLKDALFAAQNATSPDTMRALERFRQFMAGPPLHRRPFRAVEDPHTGVRDLREWLPPPLDDHDISLDLAGLGIAQIYWILGQAMLSGASVVGIEEPEAHLHAPTTGRHLRELLARLVEEKHIDQLFVATHSNLFDLDPTGFFDVRLENGETVVAKKPLDAIDQHLYEPGPTLHALEELLAIAPPDKVMFRRPDGSPVTAQEMVTMLRAADPIALDYLRNLHAAAVDVVGLRSRRAVAT